MPPSLKRGSEEYGTGQPPPYTPFEVDRTGGSPVESGQVMLSLPVQAPISIFEDSRIGTYSDPAENLLYGC